MTLLDFLNMRLTLIIDQSFHMHLKNHVFCTIFHERIMKHHTTENERHKRKNTQNSQMKPLLGLCLCRVFLGFFLSFFSLCCLCSKARMGTEIHWKCFSRNLWGIWLGAQTFLNSGNSYLVFKENLKRAWGTGIHSSDNTLC